MKTLEQTYYFNKIDFDKDGINKYDNKLFLNLIHEWDKDFNERYSPFFANYVFANDSTMILIKKCMESNTNEGYGMDLINGDIDLDTNLKIESYSKRKTVYGLGSKLNGNKDEPLFLIIDEKIGDDTVIYKYVPDDDTDDIEPEIPIPVEKKLLKVH